MRYKGLLAIALGVVTLLSYTGVAHAAQQGASGGIYAKGSGHAKSRYQRRRRPLQVNIYGGRRRGGYSYSASDVISTYGQSPPPYADVRQTPSGPFDSGFFFDSGIGPRGGNSPYQH
jgi:hypothetical protein